MPTCPIRMPVYTSSSPPTLPAPATTSQPPVRASSASGFPWASTTGPTTSRPISITQASVAWAPINRLARAAVSVVIAQQQAAPRPPAIAITRN